MQSMTRAARARPYLSRHELQRRARAEAFSRRTPPLLTPAPVKLAAHDLELIDRLVCHDRTVVSSALLAIAGIGAGAAARRAVLARVSDAACCAQAEGVITPLRAQQIERHVSRAMARPNGVLAA